MITPRENMLRIFRHEMPEWIPICGHCDPYNQPSREGMDPELAEALGTVQWRGESTVVFSRYLGLDIMDYIGPPVSERRRRVTVESRQDGEDTVVVWHTPAGELQEVHRRCRADGTSYRVEHMVKGPEDLPALAAVFEDAELALDPEGVDQVRARRELIGEDGILMCFLEGTPLGMMYRVYSGVAQLAYLYADAPQALRDLFSVMEPHYQERFRLAVQSGVDALVGMDDTSTTVISPAMFEAFSLECTDQRAEICHRAGKLYYHHSCGLIRDLLPLYRRTAMDAVHAFTVPPIGDVTIAEGRRKLGDGVTIIAGVAPLAEVDAEPETMRRGVRELFEQGGEGDHFVLTLVAYPHKTMEQTKAVVDECRKYQQVQ